MLELHNIDMFFGGIAALHDIKFRVDDGSLTGIIGPNGAGKTTIFNIITGVYTPTAGSVIFNGYDITNMKAYQINRLGIARTFQNLRLFARSSVLENVMTAAQNRYVNSYREEIFSGNMTQKISPNLSSWYSFVESCLHLGRWNRIEKTLKFSSMQLLERVGLHDRANQAAGTLPYGMQRRLEIARALALEPKLLLLDEPAAGMNPEEVFELNDLMTGIHKDFDLTVLVIEHHMDLIMKICPRIICLNFGAKIAEGTSEEIHNNPEVLEAYLGG